VTQLRERQKRNFLATLMLSQGVPMLLAGDEFSRTQGGNNNAYCQDNETSWVDWDAGQLQTGLLKFVRRLIALRKAHPAFHRRQFFQGRPSARSDLKDITWLSPDGHEMSAEEWAQSFARSLGALLSGAATGEIDERGAQVIDQDFLLLSNGHFERIEFQIPAAGGRWKVLVDTSHRDGGTDEEREFGNGERFPLEGRSLALLTRPLTPSSDAPSNE
jgi:isoamylase